MSGSRLGRGRGGRLALYGSGGVVALLLIFFYRAAVSEMTRLQELHEQCAHQQEALAAQLQVIFEYKVRLEKSLAEEKSSNAAVKQELQQRASQEKSLRDKDSIEAMRRFDSLQQTYQLLQTEHQDLQDECKKREKQALDETNKLETTLQDLRARIRQTHEEKEKLKAKYLELQDEKTQLENKYNELMATNGNADSTIDHLKKKIFQLQRELDDAKKSYRKSTSPDPVPITPRASASQSALQKEDSQPIPAPQPQQVSPLQPLYASRNIYHTDGKAVPSGNKMFNKSANEKINNTRLIQKNSNFISTSTKEIDEPSGNDFQQKKQQRNVVERPNIKVISENLFDEEQRKQVMSPPLNRRDDNSSKHGGNQAVLGSQAEQPQLAIKKASTAANRAISDKARAEDDELQALQERVNGILNHNLSHDRIH